MNYSYAQNPLIKNYSIAEGSPTNTVYSVYQDNDQFLWFSTDAGAIRFNGSEFKVFDMSDGLSDNEVIKVKQDKSGRIWFFNLNLSLNYFHNGKIYNANNSELLKSIKSDFLIHDFFETKDSTLYFYNLLYDVFEVKTNNKVTKIKIKTNESKYGTLLQLGKSLSGDFLLWTKFRLTSLSDLQDSQRIIDNLDHTRGIFSISPNKNIFVTDHKELKIYYDTICIEKFELDLGTNIVNSIITDNSGIIWISTLDKGVFCIKDKQIIYHLNIDQAQAIIQDKENNIWITSMKSGIYKISPYFSLIKHYDNSNFNNKPILKLERKAQDGIWGMNANSIYLFMNNNIYTSSKEDDYQSLKSIHNVNNNKLITTEIDQNIYISDNFSINSANHHFMLNKRMIYKGYFGKKVIINNSENKIIYYSTNKIMIYNFEDGFKLSSEHYVKSRIYNIFYNHKNELVINTQKNYLFKNDSIIDDIALQAINGQIITSQIVLNDSSEVLNVSGKSLVLLNHNKLFSLGSDTELHDKYKFKQLAYYKSQLFISTSKYLYYIKNPLSIINGGDVNIKSLEIEFNGINDIICHNDTLFVASDEGLTLIPLKNNVDYSATYNPKPYINKVLVNDIEVDFSPGTIYFKGNNKLSINFSSINYSTHLVDYFYMMKGVDNSWLSGNEGSIVYQNLPPGTYSFYVKSRTDSEEFGMPEKLTIVIKPILFQRSGFWIILSVLMSLLVFTLLYYYKHKAIKKKEIEYLLLSLEHKALQSMMNPHFIFNSLGSIQNFLLQNKSSEAGLYLSQFARLIRQNMNSLKSNFITIEDEVDRLRNYLDLEKFRMNNKFDYSIEIDPEIDPDEVLIPSMMIQVFAENAIWHGISPLDTKGKIKIRFMQTSKNGLNIFIEDNGIGYANAKSIQKSDTHLKMGMELVKKRLEILGKKYKVKSSYSISELYPGKANSGTRISLIVPVTFEDFQEFS